jgi:hypothetical protein
LFYAYDYNVMSAEDRDRQEQAFYDEFGNRPKVEGAEVGRGRCPYSMAMAGTSAALH